MQGFWGDLPKPFFVLAPMANVTDCAFRKLVAKHGKPHGIPTYEIKKEKREIKKDNPWFFMVMFTEFVLTEGLCGNGKLKALEDLKYPINSGFKIVWCAGREKEGKVVLWFCKKYHEEERPIVAQFFGDDPEKFYKSAKIAKELGFDGIDVNMGCPEKVTPHFWFVSLPFKPTY